MLLKRPLSELLELCLHGTDAPPVDHCAGAWVLETEMLLSTQQEGLKVGKETEMLLSTR